MPSPIIVGVALRDDDAAPIAFARLLMQLGDAPLVLTTVLPREMPSRVATPGYSRAIRQAAAERLAAVAHGLNGTGRVSTQVLEGSRAGELHRLADELDAAAVVIGSSHRGAVGRLLIGDVGAGLLHGSSCPTVIVPRGYESRPRGMQEIGVAFDGTPESSAALDAAIGLARRVGGTVHSVTVLEPQVWAPSYAWPGPYPSEELEASRRQWAQSVAEEALKAIPEAMTGASEVMHGKVVSTLASVSADFDALVCGSRSYGPARQVLAGSVARGLAHTAECPLVIVPRDPSAAGSSLWRQDAMAAG